MNDMRQTEALWRKKVSAFADERIAPHATKSDLSADLQATCVTALRGAGFLGSILPQDEGGLGLAPVAYGLLTAEVGRACSAARTLMTAHDIVAVAVARWGSRPLKRKILRHLATGELCAAFALSEVEAGSNARQLSTTARLIGDRVIVRGTKTWISFGLSADFILVIAESSEGTIAVLLPGDTPGLSRRPVDGMVGVRGARMAQLTFEDCEVSDEYVVGRPGFALTHVASTALDHGRFSVAWGAVGIADAALAATQTYTDQRLQAGNRLADQPLVAAARTRLGALARAARQVCLEASRLRAERVPQAPLETSMAKYIASKAAVEAANLAVHLHGARGLCEGAIVERLLRDAKSTEIIEGVTEVLEQKLGRLDLRTLQ